VGIYENKMVIVRPEIKNEPEYIVKYRNMLKTPNSVPSIMLAIINSCGVIKWNNLKKKLIREHGYKESGSFGASLRVLKLDGYVKIGWHGDEKIISSINKS